MKLVDQLEVLAVTRARFNFGKRTGGARPARPAPKVKARPQPKQTRTATKTTTAARCANCGGPHSTQACTKPAVPPEERTCFECGKTGHRAANCPNNKGVKLVQGKNGDFDAGFTAMVVECDDDWSSFCGVCAADSPPIFPGSTPTKAGSRSVTARSQSVTAGGTPSLTNTPSVPEPTLGNFAVVPSRRRNQRDRRLEMACARIAPARYCVCLLYTSDAADE